jgi:hypothetical protein
MLARELESLLKEMNKMRNDNHAGTKILLTAGTVAGPLFTLLWILESLTGANYNPLRHPVSSLALGEFGWTQIANFIIAGLLMLAFALGLWRVLRIQRASIWGSLLVALWGMGLLGAGVFLTDPVSGYPLGTPDLLLNPTSHGALHDQLSLVGFLALTVACFVFSYRFARQGERGWSFYSMLTGILFPVGIVLSSVAFSQNASLVAFGGLIQRLTITVGWTWLTLLAIHFQKALMSI